MVLTGEQILAADDLKRERVDVPEWRGCVYLRQLSYAEVFAIQSLKDDETEKRIPMILALSICGENGESILKLADIAALQKKNPKVLTRLMTKALEVSGIGDDEKAEKKS